MTTILVIDDEELVRTVFANYLAKVGFEVICCAEALEGLDAFDRYAPDLVITDLLMPGMRGMEVIAEIRKRDAHIPIFAMSGAASGMGESDLARATDLGARYVFAKPVRMGEVFELIKIELEQAKAAE